MIIGSRIPYRKLGYSTLEDLLRAIPNLTLHRVGNDYYIDLKVDDKMAHIAKMIQEQKSSKSKPVSSSSRRSKKCGRVAKLSRN